ncbi:hypothetical protein Taro_036417 [Colocasia esculenta]|uniref:Uncharacterized protein n=1 Tax=Colocasia esculenta TaxID=4460 RepID=A0A843W8D1_COLES|nr:hypothetical protein [Colocasia esculenta]
MLQVVAHIVARGHRDSALPCSRMSPHSPAHCHLQLPRLLALHLL